MQSYPYDMARVLAKEPALDSTRKGENNEEGDAPVIDQEMDDQAQET